MKAAIRSYRVSDEVRREVALRGEKIRYWGHDSKGHPAIMVITKEGKYKAYQIRRDNLFGGVLLVPI